MEAREELKDLPRKLFIKWLSVSFAIMTIIVAGVTYNLYSYFLLFGDMKGYGQFTAQAIKTTVLFGYYFGFLPGLIIRWSSPAVTFIIASFTTLTSFIVLGYISTLSKGGNLQWLSMMFFLFIGSMSGSFATICSIVSTVINFPRVLGYVVMAILIGYYKVAPYFEFTIRVTFFPDTDYFTYFIIIGSATALVQFLAAFFIRNEYIDDKFQNSMKKQDSISLIMFAVIEIGFFIVFFISSTVNGDWVTGCYAFLVTMVLNFVVLIFAAIIINNRVTRMRSRSITLRFRRLAFRNVMFFDYLRDVKFFCLLLSNFIIIGVGSTFTFNVVKTATSKCLKTS